MIRLVGFIDSHPVVFLIDSGASGNFLSSSFARSHRLRPLVSSKSPVVTLADGHQQATGGILSSVQTRVASFNESLDFTVTDLQGFDAILGMPWLQRHNPTIDWRKLTVSFLDAKKKKHVLQGAPATTSASIPVNSPSESSRPRSKPSHSLNLISHKDLVQDHRKGLLAFACLIWPEALSAEPPRSESPMSFVHDALSRGHRITSAELSSAIEVATEPSLDLARRRVLSEFRQVFLKTFHLVFLLNVKLIIVLNLFWINSSFSSHVSSQCYRY